MGLAGWYCVLLLKNIEIGSCSKSFQIAVWFLKTLTTNIVHISDIIWQGCGRTISHFKKITREDKHTL